MTDEAPVADLWCFYFCKHREFVGLAFSNRSENKPGNRELDEWASRVLRVACMDGELHRRAKQRRHSCCRASPTLRACRRQAPFQEYLTGKALRRRFFDSARHFQHVTSDIRRTPKARHCQMPLECYPGL